MSLKLKIRTQFPALVTVSDPLTLVKTGLAYAFGFNITTLRTSIDPLYIAAGTPPGYTVGSGGTVTQLTSKATAVTLSKPSGQITLNNASLAAATIVSFVMTNTFIAATDVLILNHISGGTPGSYTLNARCAAGSATIDVRNNTAGALLEAIVIQYVLVKGVIT